jgi:ApaG protein
MHTYTETTHNVQIDVTPTYLGEQGSPQETQYVFSYRVTITNNGDSAVQLLSRHWIITDGDGKVEEVKGPGVIGEQPIIPPGESHTYESFCPLSTPTGNMRGSYQMKSDSENFIDVKTPLFFLRSDILLH